MNLFDTTQLGLERAISGVGMRQATLAGNIANANTPGYQRRDVDFHKTLSAAMDAGSGAVKAVTFEPKTSRGGAMRADGNSVDMDTEMAKLSENSVGYQALISIAHARLAMLQTVIGGK